MKKISIARKKNKKKHYHNASFLWVNISQNYKLQLVFCETNLHNDKRKYLRLDRSINFILLIMETDTKWNKRKSAWKSYISDVNRRTN